MTALLLGRKRCSRDTRLQDPSESSVSAQGLTFFKFLQTESLPKRGRAAFHRSSPPWTSNQAPSFGNVCDGETANLRRLPGVEHLPISLEPGGWPPLLPGRPAGVAPPPSGALPTLTLTPTPSSRRPVPRVAARPIHLHPPPPRSRTTRESFRLLSKRRARPRRGRRKPGTGDRGAEPRRGPGWAPARDPRPAAPRVPGAAGGRDLPAGSSLAWTLVPPPWKSY